MPLPKPTLSRLLSLTFIQQASHSGAPSLIPTDPVNHHFLIEMDYCIGENSLCFLETGREGYHLCPVDYQISKRQNCARLIPTYWDMHHGVPGTLEEVPTRLRHDDEERSGQSCRYGLTRFTGAYRCLESNLEFCSGGILDEHIAAGWYGAANSHSLHELQRNTWPSMSYHLDASSLDGAHARDVVTNIFGRYMGRTNLNRGVHGTSLHNHNRSVGKHFNMHEIGNYDMRVGGDYYVDPLVSRNPFALPGSEPSEGLIGISSESGHLNNGRRGSWKRKRSGANINGPLPFNTSHFSGVRECDSRRMVSGAGLYRLDVPSFAAASSTYIAYTPNTPSMSHMLQNLHHSRGIPMGVQNSNMTDLLRETGRSSFPFSAVNAASQRSAHMRPLNTQSEQGVINFQFPFVNLRSMPILQPQSQLRHIFPAQQSREPCANERWNSTFICDTDLRFPSMTSQITGTHLITGSEEQNILSLGEGNQHVGVVALPRMRSSFEGNYPRCFPVGTADWLRTDNRLFRQTGFDPTTQNITMARNAPENYGRPYQAGTNSLVCSNSSGSPSYLSIIPVAGPAQGSMVRSAVTSHVIPVSMEAVPSLAVYQMPYPSTMQPSLSINSHTGNIVVPPRQTFSAMPFQRLRMLQTNPENRHGVSSEELVMLDQSVVLGGIDILDQHSDMRLDVDNMSYEELLALEERIGSVSMGLSEEAIAKCLRTSKYISLDVTITASSQESDVKCCICQEEYVKDDDLGILECDHSYHISCIKQWLLQKNQCPVCKATACSNP